MLAGKAYGVLQTCRRRLAVISVTSTKTTPIYSSVHGTSVEAVMIRCHSSRSGPSEGNSDNHSKQQQRHLGTSSSRNASSSASPRQRGDEPDFHPIYVHHVSRVALEHLQDNRSDWLVERGLDRNLKIRSNGTFLLNFPEYGRIWTSYDSQKRQHWLSVYRNRLAVRFLLRDHDHAVRTLHEHHQQQQAPPSARSVQDFHASSVEKIQQAVDEMIRAVESIESKQQTT